MMRNLRKSNDAPVHCRNGAVASISWERIVSLPEYQRLSAKKMLQVPSVTMKGGRRSRVTRKPLMAPQITPTSRPDAEGDRQRQAELHGELSHHDRRKNHDGADRQVDAGRQDDEGLGDRHERR